MSKNGLEEKKQYPSVSQPIKQIERTVDPEVFIRKSVAEKRKLPSIAFKLGITNLDNWEDFTKRFNILFFGVLHGIVMGIVYFIFLLNYLPLDDQLMKIFIFFLISLPLGIYLSDLQQAIQVIIISVPIWLIMSLFLLGFPALIGIGAASFADEIVTNFPRVMEFLFFLPFSLIFGIILPAVFLEFQQ